MLTVYLFGIFNLGCVFGDVPVSLVKQLENHYRDAGTVSADFKQVSFLATLNTKKVSAGRLWIQRPGKFRWETDQPDKSILVSDGKTYWFYTPPFDSTENGQVVVRSVSKAFSAFSNALLSGAFSQLKGSKISETSKRSFEVWPKAGTAGDVRLAKVNLADQRLEIQSIELIHEGGNKTEIVLSEIKLGAQLKSDLFNFKIPPKTDRVDAP